MAMNTAPPAPRASHFGYVDPNFPNPNGPNDAKIIIYGYVPNLVLCALAIALFVPSFVVHAYQVRRYRMWSFIPLTFACLMEVVGYVGRTLSSKKDPYSVDYFVIQYFFIVVAPVFISASIYVCLSRLIRWAETEGFDVQSRRHLRPKVILWIFITIDAFTTIMQIAGAASIGTAESNGQSPDEANDVLLAGLAVQSFAFIIFLGLYGSFVNALRSDSHFTRQYASKQPFLLAVGVASLLVFLRTVFRLSETAQGVGGFASTHEALFGALEFAPMIMAVWVLAYYHPGRWVPKVVAPTSNVPVSAAPVEPEKTGSASAASEIV
ncbi:MAG: hypothetical protein M1838_003546 [Thelocarpon superellum]|nr:MAG: hypothetical protein M1838_003546 [Thelocarpon superellum]